MSPLTKPFVMATETGAKHTELLRMRCDIQPLLCRDKMMSGHDLTRRQEKGGGQN
jgi:hypothetical protein